MSGAASEPGLRKSVKVSSKQGSGMDHFCLKKDQGLRLSLSIPPGLSSTGRINLSSNLMK